MQFETQINSLQAKVGVKKDLKVLEGTFSNPIKHPLVQFIE